MEDWYKHIALAIGSLWLGMLTWIGKRQMDRLDNAATKEELLQVLNRADNQTQLDREMRAKVYDKLNSVAEDVANIKGRLHVISEKNT